jgi:hypothetical protein
MIIISPILSSQINSGCTDKPDVIRRKVWLSMGCREFHFTTSTFNII